MTDSNVQELYTAHADRYARFVRFFQSRQGIQRLLETSVPIEPGSRILDAGCGFGMATFALLDALKQRGLGYESIDAFDLTPAMLSRFRHELGLHQIRRVNVAQADVLAIDALPSSWRNYDLILSFSMLEYLPKSQLVRALSALRMRLAPHGRLLVMITRRSMETKVLIDWLWHANRYARTELLSACEQAELEKVQFLRFPLRYAWLNRANHVFLAQRGS